MPATATTIKIAFVTCAALCAGVVCADQKTAKEAYYRCRDAHGQMHFGSGIPEECLGLDVEVLDTQGMVIRTIEGAATRAKRLEREAAEAEQNKLRAEQELRDKVLIETYLSVDEIERLRDSRLDLLTAQLKVAVQHIGTLKDRLQRLRDQSARFKPYSDKPNAPPLPDHIAEDLVGTLKSIAVDQQTIDIKRQEQATMTANFERDINRFKELKGIK